MKRLKNRFSQYLEHYARIKSRQILLQLSDRQLDDAGISREMLLKGTSEWPWRVVEQSLPSQKESAFPRLATASTPVTGNEYQQAVKDLEKMSDRDLHDLGITRGEIKHAVMYGPEDKAA